MSYIKTEWVDGENKYSITDQAGNIIPGFENIKLLYAGIGGTPLSQEKMNKIEQGIANAIPGEQKAAANGVATLDSLTRVPAAQLAVNAMTALSAEGLMWKMLADVYTSSEVAEIKLSSISSIYKRFKILAYFKSAATSTLRIQLNDDTGDHHSNLSRIDNNVSSAYDNHSSLDQFTIPLGYDDDTACEIDIVGYSWGYPTIKGVSYNSTQRVEVSGKLSVVGGVTSIRLFPVGNFAVGTKVVILGSTW